MFLWFTVAPETCLNQLDRTKSGTVPNTPGSTGLGSPHSVQTEKAFRVDCSLDPEAQTRVVHLCFSPGLKGKEGAGALMAAGAPPG